jgi:hypothetical protein
MDAVAGTGNRKSRNLKERLHTTETELAELRRELHRVVDHFVDVARDAYHSAEPYRSHSRPAHGVTGETWAWLCNQERAGAYRNAAKQILKALHDWQYADQTLVGLLSGCEEGTCDHQQDV